MIFVMPFSNLSETNRCCSSLAEMERIEQKRRCCFKFNDELVWSLQVYLDSQIRLFVYLSPNTGRVIKITDPPRDTFHRLFVIYNRAREWPEDDKFMTNSILTNLRDNARRFPSYKVHRTSLIWPTRGDLLSYIRLLQLEAKVGKIIEQNTEASFREVVQIWKECKPEWVECVEEGRGHVTEVPWFQSFTPGVVERRRTSCRDA